MKDDQYAIVTEETGDTYERLAAEVDAIIRKCWQKSKRRDRDLGKYSQIIFED